MKQDKILVVDDDPNNIMIIEEGLDEKEYKISSANNGKEGIEIFKEEKPKLVLLDVMMPGINGIETLKRMQNIDKSIPIVMISANATIRTAVEAMKIGARDFLLKPIILTQLELRIKEILENQKLKEENNDLKAALNETTGLYGKSKQMKNVINKIEKSSSTNINVMILGESGTGKELVAKAIHNLSNRRNKSFIAINCGAIPKDLVESELFGHEKGAFTSAISKKIGRFQQANGGTLFLDEIADLSFDSQVKLLRAIEEQEIQPIGSTQKIKTDVRIISATNQKLEELIKENKFREDLYYRLNVFPIYIPPLRERKEDIMILANHFLAEISSREGNLAKSFSETAIEKLKTHYFKGNIRELRNIVERAYIMAEGSIMDIVPDEILMNKRELSHQDEALDLNIVNHGELFINNGEFISLEEIERMAIKKALEYYSYNLSNTARKLNIGRDTLYRKIKNYDIDIKR